MSEGGQLWPCTKDRLDRERQAELNGTKAGPTPYDRLHDYTSGPIHERAKRAALNLCAECPIRTECWADPANEQWVRSILGKRKPGPKPSAKCGTPGGARRHARVGEPSCEECRAAERERSVKKRAIREGWQRGLQKRQELQAAERERRMAILHDLVEMGADLHEACRALDMRRDALNKWCLRNKVSHLYHQLNGTRPKGAAA